jgi:Fe-S oxidoreductase
MIENPFRSYQRGSFDRERCTGCGECFHHCPVMHLPLERAQQEMTRLLQEGTSLVLRRCTSCLACNQICPEDCRPANLILDHWHGAYLREGLPTRATYFLPHARPNFRTDIVARLPPEEREAVAHWRHGGPSREFLFSGCNLITTPYLTFSPLFEGIEIRGGLDYCCGEMLFRMGLYEAVEQVAARLSHWFRHLGAERVFLLCTAGLNMLRNILPQFGADFAGIEFLPYLAVILERLEQGDLGSIEHVDLKVSVQDSCHTRTVEPGFADLPRQILETIGIQIEEAPHHKGQQLCCGIGGGFAHDSAYHPFDLLLSARATSRDHRRSPAGATCVYCSGCLEMMSVARWADPNRRPVYHLLEIVQMATGGMPSGRQDSQDRLGSLAFQFVLGTVRRQFPLLLSRERIWLADLPPEPVPEGAV